jgi:4-amino-4-deoxy-L-arabinose transferase-like glycosyltransferase
MNIPSATPKRGSESPQGARLPPAVNAPGEPCGQGWARSIIPAQPSGVTALSVHAFLAIMVGLALRLAFVYRFPGSAGDSEIYLQLARNWASHHVYGLLQNGQLVPTDLRTPGYPAFLAGVALLFGRSTGAILLSQAVLDVFTSILTAALAAALAPASARRRVATIALWLAATCPFVANYSAVVLTEILAAFLTTAALLCFARSLSRAGFSLSGFSRSPTPNTNPDRLKPVPLSPPFRLAVLGGFLTGVATLVRPEMPLLLGVAILVYAVRGWPAQGARKTLMLTAAMAALFLVPVLPWAARNLLTLKKVQFLAPRYATLPGEYAPVGYFSWTKTWLVRYRDVYLSVWKIGEEPVELEDIPENAFDSPEEKARIADLIEQYNDSNDLDISPGLDRKFAEIARERAQRHPLRTYLRVPFERALTIWFTPRTELLPLDGKFWPLREQWEDSHADVLVTGGFAALGYLYVALAAGAIWLAWRTQRRHSVPASPAGTNLWGIGLVLAYFLVRTAFLTTVEAPEPRYVVSCYPAFLALVSLLGIGSAARESSGPVSS